MQKLGIKVTVEDHVYFDVIEPESGYQVERFEDLVGAAQWAVRPMCQYEHGLIHDFDGSLTGMPCGFDATRRIVSRDQYSALYGEFPYVVEYLCETHADEIHEPDATISSFEMISDEPLTFEETSTR